jgi:hypothetical protein
MPPHAKNQPAAMPAEGTIQPLKPFQRMLKEMAGIATMDETIPGEFDNADADRILEAGTAEEMWDADDLAKYNAKMLSGCELAVYGIEVKFSRGDNEEIVTRLIDPASGKAMYLLVHSVRLSKAGSKKEYNLPEPGEEFVWNTSARAIVPKLWWMFKRGWFDAGASPVRVTIKGTDLGGGKSIEKLKELVIPAAMSTAEEPPF